VGANGFTLRSSGWRGSPVSSLRGAERRGNPSPTVADAGHPGAPFLPAGWSGQRLWRAFIDWPSRPRRRGQPHQRVALRAHPAQPTQALDV